MIAFRRTFNRSFNVDRYLAGQPQPEPLSHRFRAWAIRLDERCEAWLDRTDWIAVELKLEKIGARVLTGVGIYFLFVLANAFLQARFSLGGR